MDKSSPVKVIECDTTAYAHFAMVEAALMGTWEFDVNNGDRQFFTNMFIRVNKASPLNIGLSNFTPNRWQTFLKDYVEPRSFNQFLYRMTHEVKKGQELVYQVPVGQVAHRHGNCLIAVFGSLVPAEITLVSRATLFAPTGVLDLAFGGAVVDALRKATGINFKLNWQITQAQFCCFRTQPLIEYYNLGPRLDALEHPNHLARRAKVWRKRWIEQGEASVHNYATEQRIFKHFKRLRDGLPNPEYYPSVEQFMPTYKGGLIKLSDYDLSFIPDAEEKELADD